MLPWNGKNIYFLGFMASGKSCVGQEFAKLLGWPFVDSDSYVEEMAGKPIHRIFAEEGESFFRKLERRAVRDLSRRIHHVVALGGGAIISERNWTLISASGLTIRLIASEEVLYERIRCNRERPLMALDSEQAVRRRIRTLLQQREPYYSRAQYCFESRADVSARRLARIVYRKLLEGQ